MVIRLHARRGYYGQRGSSLQKLSNAPKNKGMTPAQTVPESRD